MSARHDPAWGFLEADRPSTLAVAGRLTLEYTVQVTDASGATGTQTVTVTGSRTRRRRR